MAVSTNTTRASKYSMNIADDLPLAIYDILPDVDLMQEPPAGSGDAFYDNAVYPPPPHPTLLDEAGRWSWFSIPSQHCVLDSTAYYLRSHTDGESEWPVVSGLPMLYGGSHRTRYALLSRDVSVSEPPLPFLQVPSFGVGQTYEDRARTIEFWIDTDPYHHPVNMNMFDDQTAIYSPEMDAGVHYVLDGTGFVLNPVGVPLKNPDANIIDLNNTKITFIKDQPVVASRKVYTFAITARSHAGTEYESLTASLKFTQERVDSDPLVKIYTDTFQVYEANGWTTFVLEFVPNEAMTFPTVEVSLHATGAMYLTEMGLWAGQGGKWAIPSFDVGADIEFFTTARPTEILSVGGVNGSAVELLADDSYFYLRSVDNIDCYYVGEWGRQMYMCLIDEGAKYTLYMNTEAILTVPKSDKAQTGVAGEYLIYYISPLFKYIDISTIAIYQRELPRDIMKLHYIFGGGPKYVDVLKRMPYQNTFIADGSAVKFSDQALFPQSHPFSAGTPYGVAVSNNTLSLPDYPLPQLLNKTYDQIEYYLSEANEYSVLYFKIPDGGFMRWAPRKDVSDDINYIFIDIASLLSNNVPDQNKQRLCRIESDNTPFVLDFYIEIDISSTGDYEDSEFNRDFATTEKTGSVYAVMKDAAEVEDPGTGIAVEVFRQAIIQSDFALVFNIDKLREYPQRAIAIIFSDPSFRIVFDNEVDLKSFSCCTRENLYANNILFDHETDLDAIQIDNRYDDFGTDQRGVLQNATYSVYPNASIIDGRDVLFLDRAANGYWKVNIPLVNLAQFINGKPDLDFIMYTDSERLPQIVSGLNTNRLTYSELQTYIHMRTQAGTYGQGQALFADKMYMEVGVEVMNVVPTLGRFANPAVQTFVTLDSQTRWPFKDYSRLQKVKADTSMLINFDKGPSVVDSKWEIFNNFAIRVPANITLSKYELAYAVHLRSSSLTLQRPVVRNIDFFGVASGTSTINAVTTGTGSKIYIGNSGNIDTKFSMHIPTETFPSALSSKSYGFYPHSDITAEGDGNIIYQFMHTQGIKTVSFYLLWRCETFPTSTEVNPGLVDTIGHFNYNNLSDVLTKNTLQVKSASGVAKLSANLQFTTPGPTIHVDSVPNGLIWANKWHLIQINFSDAKDNMTYLQSNSKAVMNFIAASTSEIEPLQLYASRTGIPNVYLHDETGYSRAPAKGYLLSMPFDASYKATDLVFKL